MPAYFSNAEVNAETEKALLVEFSNGDEKWIPKSVIHEDSEVFNNTDNDEGELVIKTWWADQEGLLDFADDWSEDENDNEF